MMPYLTDSFGNAASRNHPFGWEAEQAVDQARETAAGLIGGKAKEIVWLSGATESDNVAIKGAIEFMVKEHGWDGELPLRLPVPYDRGVFFPRPDGKRAGTSTACSRATRRG